MIFISKNNAFHCMRPIKKCIFFLEIKRDAVPRRNILFPGSFFFLYRKKYQTLNGPFQITSRFEDHASNNTFQVLFFFFFWWISSLSVRIRHRWRLISTSFALSSTTPPLRFCPCSKFLRFCPFSFSILLNLFLSLYISSPFLYSYRASSNIISAMNKKWISSMRSFRAVKNWWRIHISSYYIAP